MTDDKKARSVAKVKKLVNDMEDVSIALGLLWEDAYSEGYENGVSDGRDDC